MCCGCRRRDLVAVTTVIQLLKVLAVKDVHPLHVCVETVGMDAAQMELHQPRVSTKSLQSSLFMIRALLVNSKCFSFMDWSLR